MKTIYGLSAKGDSMNGWSFRMFCKQTFTEKSKAEAYIPTFKENCCDTKKFECADPETIKITVVEFELNEQLDNHRITMQDERMKIELKKIEGMNRWEIYSDKISSCFGIIEKDGYGVWFTSIDDFSLKAEDLEEIAKAMKELK